MVLVATSMLSDRRNSFVMPRQRWPDDESRSRLASGVHAEQSPVPTCVIQPLLSVGARCGSRRRPRVFPAGRRRISPTRGRRFSPRSCPDRPLLTAATRCRRVRERLEDLGGRDGDPGSVRPGRHVVRCGAAGGLITRLPRAGCAHTIEVGGGLPVASRPRPRVDAFAEKIDE